MNKPPKEYRALVRLTYDVAVTFPTLRDEYAEEDAMEAAEAKLKLMIDVSSADSVEVIKLEQQ